MLLKLERGLIKKLNGSMFVNVMVNKETGEVWGTQHSDANSWVQYSNKNIIFVTQNTPYYSATRNWTTNKVRLAVLEKLTEIEERSS